MTATLLWRPDIAELRGPRYLAIAEALAADVAAGRLKPGDLLPTQRELASALEIDLTTVTRAYGEARRRGLIEAVVGRGTYVRAAAPAAAAPVSRASLDLTMTLPPQPPEARLGERLAAALAAVQREPDFLSLLSYRPSAGGEADRAAGAAWLAGRLGAVAAERVLVCAGAQAAMLVALGTLVPRGAKVACEAVTYPGFRALAQQLGLEPVGVALDDEGMIPAALEDICRREQPPRALYCVPTIHNPTTATMSLARRAQIAKVARRHDLTIFEDDAYGMLASDGPPALASFAPERGVYVAGMAKCLAPGLRIAYLVAPDNGVAARLAAGMRATTLMTSPLLAAVATRWILDGTASAITAAIRDESAARQRIAAEILTRESYRAHAQGHHLWLNLPEGISRIEFAGHMRQQGLAVVASDAFAVTAPAPSAVRVSLGGMAREEVRPTLTRLADAIARGEPLAEVI